MKPWQIFAVGMVAVIAVFFLSAIESLLAGVAAILIIAAVIAGFCLTPRTDVFYLRTTVQVPDPDYAVVVEHDRLAVRIEVARLWLLFLPTFLAVAFLVVTSMKGTTWKISLLDSGPMAWFQAGPYPVLLFFRLLIVAVFGLLAAWLSERWILLDATACSASYLYFSRGYIQYGFTDPRGEYYGGEGFPSGFNLAPHLRTIVFYRASKPDLSKIAMSFVFHRPTVIGRGVTDFDEAKTAAVLATDPAAS
jgi:hypothetical protein